MKLVIGIIIVSLSLLILLGCNSEIPTTNTVPEPAPAAASPPPPPPQEETLVLENVTLPAPAGTCTFNSNCTQGSYCVEGICKTISSLYETEGCALKCNFKDVIIDTSDGETYTVSRGQGSYTAAGALQWVVMSGPSYCQGTPVVVPISILKKNYDTIYADEVILLQKGEASNVITHPLVKRVAFTVTVKDFKEECS